MKAIFSLRKHSYLKTIGTFVIAIALIAGIVGCEGEGETEYALTMTGSPAAGGTATDETGASPYTEGTDVSIKAVANPDYEFDGWTAPAGTFADAAAAETTFTMPGQNVTATANFVPVYDLTMAVNPAAGGTATDETGTSPYRAGTVVDIEAVATPPYQFVKWTATEGAFADENAATTTFTMPAEDVTVTANFVGDLTMAVNPAAGGTATDETGTSPYRAGTVVDIEAVATPPYQFVKWTATEGVFADENAATTTFTMPAEDVTVTANFVGPMDHFTAYEVDSETAPYVGEEVYLEDQFVSINATVGSAVFFGNPAQKVHGDVTTPILNPDHHMVAYSIDYEGEPQYYLVTVSNQLGENQVLKVYGPVALGVPTQKEGHEAPLSLAHYLIYEVLDGPYIGEWISLADQFGEQPAVEVHYPMAFANPVKKIHGDEVTEIVNPDVHGVFYYAEGGDFEGTVKVVNQFHEEEATLDVFDPYGVGVPSQKIDWEPLLEHFRVYQMDFGTEPFVGEVVQLQDQFHGEPFDVLVGEGVAFCNPADKLHDDLYYPAIHYEYHLMVYNIYHEEPTQVWEVTVDNQFGDDQVLSVTGPVALAVPTHKLFPDDWGPPEGLDHFLLYDVLDFTAIPAAPVWLWDQFLWDFEENWVYEPLYFANPVQKDYLGEVTEIQNPDWHTVFYLAEGVPLVPPMEVGIENQLQPFWAFTVTFPTALGVPSTKTDWSLSPA